MRQTGSILIQTLIFLVVIGIISSTIIQFTESEIHTTAIYHTQHYNLNEAQRALNDAEISLASVKSRPIPQDSCQDLACVYHFSNLRNFYDHEQWKKLGILVSSNQPTYFMIERLATQVDGSKTIDYYQITAISWSEHNKSQRLAQSVVSKSFNENALPLSTTIKKQSWRLILS